MVGAYFDQFNVVKVVSWGWPHGLGMAGDWWPEVYITNAMMMLGIVGVGVVVLLRCKMVIPGRWQLIGEIGYSILRSIVFDTIGKEGVVYTPFIVVLFVLIVSGNLLGLWPYVFTPTAHIVVTLGVSVSIILAVTISGFKRFNWDYWSMLVPTGIPLIISPFLVVIETISYCIRGLSLGIRLAANISAGHLLLAIVSGFGYSMCSSGVVLAVFSVIPGMIVWVVTVLEVVVAVIQAYVFSLLTAIYLGDAVAMH